MLDDFRLWVGIAIALVVIAYGISIWSMVADGALVPSVPGVPGVPGVPV